jgi:class 3 adenylate cyclase
VWARAGFAAFTMAMAASLSRKVAGIAREVRRGRDVFRLFVPEQLLDKIAKEGLDSIKLGSVEEGKATVLFTDIRSFASIAENLSPGDTLAFLNSFMQRMQPIIHDHGGFICQFVGDEIMAIFYMPEQGAAAVRAAIDMRMALETHNHERLSRGEQPIDAGIGVNTGRVILGTIGSEARMESCVIGDTVNLASRIQGLTKFYGVKVLISESTYRELQSPGQFHAREIDLVQVKGKSRPVAIYEIFDADSEELKALKRAALAPHERGLRYFRERGWEKARTEFEACLALSQEDSIARLYLERCEEYFNHPPGPEWNGVTVLHDK